MRGDCFKKRGEIGVGKTDSKVHTARMKSLYSLSVLFRAFSSDPEVCVITDGTNPPAIFCVVSLETVEALDYFRMVSSELIDHQNTLVVLKLWHMGCDEYMHCRRTMWMPILPSCRCHSRSQPIEMGQGPIVNCLLSEKAHTFRRHHSLSSLLCIKRSALAFHQVLSLKLTLILPRTRNGY